MVPLPASKGSPWRLLHQAGREGPVSIPEGCHDEGPQTGCLQTREICSPMLLEVRNLESRHQQCMLPPKALGEAPSHLLQPQGVAGNLGAPWLAAASLRSVPALSHGVLPVYVCLCVFEWLFPLCVSVSRFPLSYEDTSHWVRA